jgi:outer membrane protein assembly factor BamB
VRAFLAAACLILLASPPAAPFEIAGVREILRTKEHGIVAPGAIAQLGGGAIVVTDRAGRSLACFSREGKLLWKTDGTETGEAGFLDPASVASSTGLALFVLDRGARKILRFDGRGAFQGYLQNDEIDSPACLAQGEGGDLYLYDSRAWELVCLDTDGNLRWKTKPAGVTGPVSMMRVSQGDIYLFLPDTRSISRYGRFGEFLSETKLRAPAGEAEPVPTSFWKSADGSLYVTTEDGRLVVYDGLANPVTSVRALGDSRLERPCDLFLSGNLLYLIDCGTGTLYEITMN